MKIKSLKFLKGAEKAEGLTVIIDVFRAYTTAAYLFAGGAARVFIVSKVKSAFKLKKELNSAVLIGERKGIKLAGFDYNNSPYFISQQNFKNNDIILSTSAGTKGVIAAQNAEEIICGSFVTISAAAEYIKEKNPDKLSLVAMGNNGATRAAEDELYQQQLKNILQGKKIISKNKLQQQLRHPAGDRFFVEETQTEMPKEDYYFSLEIDKFDFLIKAQKHSEGVFQLIRIDN